MSVPFANRREAGRALASHLSPYQGLAHVLVLALPRGGVPAGYEVAEALDAPLDVFVVRKLGVPGHEELAMGAIASGGIRVVNEEVVRSLDISPSAIEGVASHETHELERRERQYRGDRLPADVQGRIVILVDDGLATGSTMRAAAAAVKQRNPMKLVVAVPVAAPDTCDQLRREVDEVVCALTPEPFHAVGIWYEDFTQTTDQEVHDLLSAAARRHPVHSSLTESIRSTRPAEES